MPQGLTEFCGFRLEEARIARGLTQTSLAKIIDKDASTVSSWESERQYPDWESISRLCDALSVRGALFFKGPVSEDADHFYRSNVDATLALRKRARAKLRWAELICYELGEWIDFPMVDIPYSGVVGLGQISDECIEKAADECRAAWGLRPAPVKNLTKLVEAAGVIVIRDELGGVKMDGVSAHLGGRPFVLLAEDKSSAARSRFDLAHELGHLVLHRAISPEALTRSEYIEMERQAHLFAAAFLLPSEAFLRELTSLDLDSFVERKARWGVSVSAMIMRCAHLDVISTEYKHTLFRYMGARGWRKREPLDDQLKPELPSVLSSAIQLVLDAKKYSNEELLDDFGLNASDVEAIASLPQGFMSKESADIVRLKF